MLVGIKPTVGRISRYGIIPITADQDTAGPMARTVTDAAILLGVLEAALPDPNDVATKRCEPPLGHDYTSFLTPSALKGARIGIPRAFFYDEVAVPGREKPTGGLNKEQRAVMDEAIAILKAQAAVVVDPADIPSVLAPRVDDNLVAWGVCSGTTGARGQDAGCSIDFKYGMKRDFNAWLKSLGDSAPVKTLTELRLWNLAHTQAGALKYGQSNLDISDEMDLERDKARYESDRAKDIRLAGTNGIDAAMATHTLDALLFAASSGASIAARPGYPTVIVPFGQVPNAPTQKFPDGFEAKRRRTASPSPAWPAASRGLSRWHMLSNRRLSGACRQSSNLVLRPSSFVHGRSHHRLSLPSPHEDCKLHVGDDGVSDAVFPGGPVLGGTAGQGGGGGRGHRRQPDVRRFGGDADARRGDNRHGVPRSRPQGPRHGAACLQPVAGALGPGRAALLRVGDGGTRRVRANAGSGRYDGGAGNGLPHVVHPGHVDAVRAGGDGRGAARHGQLQARHGRPDRNGPHQHPAGAGPDVRLGIGPAAGRGGRGHRVAHRGDDRRRRGCRSTF